MIDSTWIECIIIIRDNGAGEERTYFDLLNQSNEEVDLYPWEEGNYSCDCNRRLFFARAKGEAEDWETGCSEGAYSARILDKKTNHVYYDEIESTKNP
jgi:hypothetical protein